MKKKISRAVLGGLWALGLLFSFFPAASAAEPKTKNLFPDLVLCEKNKNVLAHINRGTIDWEYALDGPLKDVQPQPQSGRYLVTGGTKQVFLLRRAWKGGRVLWDWTKMEGVSIVSAVGADWDEEGNPSLVLAADALNQRIFLAEAKSKAVKIRWDYKLPSTPIRVHLCPDSGNFLVVLEGDQIEEIHFQEDKVTFELGKSDGFGDARDAVRDSWANTYVADAKGGDIFCFGPHGQLNWKTHLPIEPGEVQDMALSLFRKSGKRLVLASVHFTGTAQMARNILYVLNSENGKVKTVSDRLEKNGYPDFFKVMPDQAEYYKKQ